MAMEDVWIEILEVNISRWRIENSSDDSEIGRTLHTYSKVLHTAVWSELIQSEVESVHMVLNDDEWLAARYYICWLWFP